MTKRSIGIIGGTGWLGGVLARAMLSSGALVPQDLWLSNRSGRRDGFESWTGITFTTDNRELAGQCGIVMLAILPGHLRSLDIDLADRLVVSVMAGATVARICEAARYGSSGPCRASRRRRGCLTRPGTRDARGRRRSARLGPGAANPLRPGRRGRERGSARGLHGAHRFRTRLSGLCRRCAGRERHRTRPRPAARRARPATAMPWGRCASGGLGYVSGRAGQHAACLGRHHGRRPRGADGLRTGRGSRACGCRGLREGKDGHDGRLVGVAL
jgi:hypothetical protein